jgi:hypothetical protein
MTKARKPTAYKCPECEARPGAPCRKTRGANAGQEYPAAYVHRARRERAGLV